MTQTSWLLITIFGAAAVDGVLSTVVVPVTVPEDVDVVAVVATVLLSAPNAVCDNIPVSYTHLTLPTILLV